METLAGFSWISPAAREFFIFQQVGATDLLQSEPRYGLGTPLVPDNSRCAEREPAPPGRSARKPPHYSGSSTPEPPNSFGMSRYFGSPSRIDRVFSP